MCTVCHDKMFVMYGSSIYPCPQCFTVDSDNCPKDLTSFLSEFPYIKKLVSYALGIEQNIIFAGVKSVVQNLVPAFVNQICPQDSSITCIHYESMRRLAEYKMISQAPPGLFKKFLIGVNYDDDLLQSSFLFKEHRFRIVWGCSKKCVEEYVPPKTKVIFLPGVDADIYELYTAKYNYITQFVSESLSDTTSAKSRNAAKVLLNYIKNLSDDHGKYCVMLIGPPKTGKTYLLSLAYNEFKKRNWLPFYISCPDMFGVINSFKQDFIDFLKDVPALIIDNCGIVSFSPYFSSVFYQIIDYRTHYALPTILAAYTDNDIPQQIATKIDEAYRLNK